MNIRLVEKKDIPKILALLSQVLELHAKIRPDIFVEKTTKYNESELLDIFADESRRTFVATDDSDEVIGYAFCEIQEPPKSDNLVKFRTVYIDDLCVDRKARGQGVGTALFDYVKSEAKALGCYEITLNVWEGNDSARAFYDNLGMKPKETLMEIIL